MDSAPVFEGRIAVTAAAIAQFLAARDDPSDDTDAAHDLEKTVGAALMDAYRRRANPATNAVCLERAMGYLSAAYQELQLLPPTTPFAETYSRGLSSMFNEQNLLFVVYR